MIHLQSPKGFTAIELMLVISIISILVAVAVPAYTDYIKRAQTSEALLLAFPVKKAIQDYYQYHGRLPTDNLEAGVESAEQLQGEYVRGMVIENGVLHIQLRDIGFQDLHAAEKNSDNWLSLCPIIQPEYPLYVRYWQCGCTDTPELNRTNILSQYLPTTCR